MARFRGHTRSSIHQTKEIQVKTIRNVVLAAAALALGSAAFAQDSKSAPKAETPAAGCAEGHAGQHGHVRHGRHHARGEKAGQHEHK
jgi:hypothetical protein